MFNFFKNIDPNQLRAGSNILKFLAMMLAFTLIARGTSAATLARVDISTPVRSDILEAISGSATVVSTDITDVFVPEGLTIYDMLVGPGQLVEIGDAVAVFSQAEIEEMHVRETAALDRMRLDLNRLERDESVDTTPVENARRTLSRAQADYRTTVSQGEADVAAARESLDQLLVHAYETGEDVSPASVRNHLRALEDYNAIVTQGYKDMAAAEETLQELLLAPPTEYDDTTMQNAVRNHERAIDDYNATVIRGEEDIATAQADLNELRNPRTADMDRTALNTAQRNHQRAQEDYRAARSRGDENVRAANIALSNAFWAYDQAVSAADPGAIAAALAEIERAEAAVRTAQNTRDDSIFTANRILEDATANLTQAQQNFDNTSQDEIERAEAALETAKTRAEDNRLTARRWVEDTELTLAQARLNFGSDLNRQIEYAEAALESTIARVEEARQSAARRVEDTSYSANAEIERAQTALQTAITRAAEDRQSAARRVEDAAASLNTAEQTHEHNIQQNYDTMAQNTITAATLALDIQNQQETINILDKLLLSGGIFYTDTPGVIITTMAAGTLVGNAPLVAIRNDNGGFEAQMQISHTDAEHLSIGSESEVTTGGGSIFFNPTVTGTVSGITQPDENDRVTITIALPESNWSAGQRVDAQIVLSRGNFDLSVPISALRSDNMGYFVYAMAQRNTVLGIQNMVERVNVTIAASDSEMVSIRGPVDSSSQIITSSNKAITAGDRVRVNE